jgi:hypothetical protein
VNLSVRYVEGTVSATGADRWEPLRSEGVDHVDLADGLGTYRMQGQSLYWVRREGSLWVMGGGTVTDVQEVWAFGEGRFQFTRPPFMPDLAHEEVKLGWWLPCQ